MTRELSLFNLHSWMRGLVVLFAGEHERPPEIGDRRVDSQRKSDIC